MIFKHYMTVAAAAVFALSSHLGCLVESESNGNSGSSVSTADCSERCLAKANSCGAPQDMANSQCSGLCDLGPSESELSCVESSDCAALTNDAVCDIGAQQGSGSGSSGSGSSGSGMPSGGECIDAGDECDPNGSAFQCEGFVCSCNGKSTGVEWSGCSMDTYECRGGAELCEGKCDAGESTSHKSVGCD